MSPTVICPKCGADNSIHSSICDSCYAPLTDRPDTTQANYLHASRICSKCGAPNSSRSTICDNCFAPLTDDLQKPLESTLIPDYSYATEHYGESRKGYLFEEPTPKEFKQMRYNAIAAVLLIFLGILSGDTRLTLKAFSTIGKYLYVYLRYHSLN